MADHTWYTPGQPGAPKAGDLVVLLRDNGDRDHERASRLRGLAAGELAKAQAAHVASLRDHKALAVASELGSMAPDAWREYMVATLEHTASRADALAAEYMTSDLLRAPIAVISQDDDYWYGVSPQFEGHFAHARYVTPAEIASEAGQLAVQAYRRWLATRPVGA